MLKYSFQRFLGAIPTLFLLITIAFFMIRVAPGGPFDTERDIPAEIQAKLDAKYHLDEPLYQQYFRYLTDIMQGDFGPSFQYRDFTVNELIFSGFPVSAKLGISAMLLALLIGCTAGIIAALKQNKTADYSIMAAAMTGISVPSFVLAPLMILFFAIILDWLPAGGWQRGRISDMIMPVTALALPVIAYVARLTRGGMIEILRSPYIRTAHAKGLPLRLVLLRHAWKPALLPVVSFLGPATAGIITGSVVIESIFGIPGIGRYFVQGALNRDYTLVMGVVLFYGILIILFNFVVDLLYAWLDPRVRNDYS